MSRQRFVESWLGEMPERRPKTDYYPIISHAINDLKSSEFTDEQILPDGTHKIELSRLKYYWRETDSKPSEIIIGIELSITPESLQVNMIGKNPKWAKSVPAAVDLYETVIRDNNRSLLMSDETVTDAGLNVWKELLNRGHKLSVYDTSTPGKTFMTVHSDADLEQVFGDDSNLRKKRFVISENNITFVDTKMTFNTRRMRELTGIL